MSRDEALKLAQEKGLDLIEVAPTANPPVARIMDYGKYLYREAKEERKQRAKQKYDEMKVMRLTLNIGLNDMKFKAAQVDKFLKEGLKVQIELILRGRAKYHKTFHDLGREKLEEFLKLVTEPLKITRELKKQPAGFNMVIAKK